MAALWLLFARFDYMQVSVLVTVGVLIAAAAVWIRRWSEMHGPPDCTGNSITIGLPKVFDSRSLSLKMEQLTAGLEALRVVNQNVTENLPLSGKDRHGAVVGCEAVCGAAKPPAEPSFGLTASDALTDQLNLASQIVNLRTLFERSLSDTNKDGSRRGASRSRCRASR